MELVTYSVNAAEGLGLKRCKQYSLTRMRSWKVGYTRGLPCLKFHYQEGKDSFVWVTITGEKAVFLALCLHCAVNELLRVRSKRPIRTPKDQVTTSGVSHSVVDGCMYMLCILGKLSRGG